MYGLRELILDHKINYLTANYKNSSARLRHIQFVNTLISSLPRFAIEAIAFVIIGLFVIVAYSINYNSSIDLLPTLAAFALSAQKILPSIQQIYSTTANLKSVSSPIQEYSKLFRGLRSKYDVDEFKKTSITDTCSDPLSAKEFRISSLDISCLSFKYPNSKDIIIRDLNLNVVPGDHVAFVGTSGSGKSTLMDLILGLIDPTSGQISFVSNNKIYPLSSSSSFSV